MIPVVSTSTGGALLRLWQLHQTSARQSPFASLSSLLSVSCLLESPPSLRPAFTTQPILVMSDPIADAAQKHPAPEGLVYTYGTAGVCEAV